jgi:hypothetical protein
MKDSDRRFCRENCPEWIIDGRFTALGVLFNIDQSKMITEHLLPKINSMKCLLNIWKSRNLTPLGKITVIKSLTLPIITHLLTVLPDPDTNIITDIENIFFNFIWNKPIGKVKKATLKKEYGEGGLRMVDLASYIKGLKISWIRRVLTKSDKWTLFAKSKLPEILFESGANQINTFKYIDNPFWRDVALAWAEYNNIIKPQNIENILNEPIWFNKHINLGYIESWHKKGLIYVKHLLDENGVLLSFEQLKLKFNIKATFIDVIRLHKAIPPEWLYRIATDVTHIGAGPSITPAVQSVLSAPTGCKLFYHKFNNTEVTSSIVSQGKWS